MKKAMKNTVIILLIVFLMILIAAGIVYYKMSPLTSKGNDGAAVYSGHIEIWNVPAGYSKEKKLDRMNVKTDRNAFMSQIEFISAIVNDEYKDEEVAIDTFTYLYEIKAGYESELFDDKPYLIPYLCEGSDSAVIVLPGGGFGFKSIDGGTAEGEDIAVTLQKNGVNAFVLHYRSNPYEYPIPVLDAQRAVRWLRHHASEYGIDPDKISLIGFSAGGFTIGSFISQIRGNDCFPDDYKPDEIDKEDDSIASAAMIYPALSFNANVPMLFALFDAEEVRNASRRAELLRQVDLKSYVQNSKDVPQFVAWGTKDKMVGTSETPAYIEAARSVGADVTEVVVKGKDHGFVQKYYMDAYLDWLKIG